MADTEIENEDDLRLLDTFQKSNTKRNTRWALTIWNAWRSDKMAKDPQQKYIPYFRELAELPVASIDEHLCTFVLELKRKDGNEYPMESLKGIIFGVRRFLKACFLAKNRPEVYIIGNYHHFPKFNKAFKEKKVIIERQETLADMKKKQAQIVSYEHEKILWDKGVFGCHSAKAMSDTMFFYVCKIFGFALTGLRLLRIDHFRFSEDEHGKYVEIDKKFCNAAPGETIFCRTHGIEVRDKGTLRHYLDPTNSRSFYNLLIAYIDTLSKTKCIDPSFFIAPKGQMVFGQCAMGRNNLQQRCQRIMTDAGIEGYFTNQSLVQSVPSRLQAHGFNLKRRQTFLPEEHLEICKLLDPPPGILNTAAVQKQILRIISMTPTLPAAVNVVTQVANGNPVPVVMVQSADGSTDSQKPRTSSASLANNADTIQNTQMNQRSLTDQQSSTGGDEALAQVPLNSYMMPAPQFSSTVSDIGKPITLSVPNSLQMPMTNQTVSLHALTNSVTASSVQTLPGFFSVGTSNNAVPSTSVVHPDPLSGRSESASSSGMCPGFSSKLEVATHNAGINAINTMSNNVQIKLEPVEVDNEYTKASNTTQGGDFMGATQDRICHTSGTADQNDMKSDGGACQGTDIVKCDVDANSDVSHEMDDCEKTQLATIRYRFKNDTVKNTVKQEVVVIDDDQDMFSFSGTNKMGKTSSDLDLNLGDYLPEDCVIKPCDINLKRVVTSTGGELVINLKYSVNNS